MGGNDILGKVGSWAFLIGISIALIVGLYYASTIETYVNEPTAENASNIFFLTDNGGAVAWLLAVLGAIIGVLAVLGRGTITKQETPSFLLAGIGLVVMGGVFSLGVGTDGNTSILMNLTPWIGSLLAGVSFSLSIFVAPAVGILAIKAIWDMGKD